MRRALSAPEQEARRVARKAMEIERKFRRGGERTGVERRLICQNGTLSLPDRRLTVRVAIILRSANGRRGKPQICGVGVGVRGAGTADGSL
jgi:hypothetical protein